MSDDLRCPSCGHMNEHEATACAHCNFPLRPGGPAMAATPPPAAAPPAAPKQQAPAAPQEPAGPPAHGFDPTIRRMRPIRPRPPRGPEQQLQTQLWVVLGGLAILVLIYTAFMGAKKNRPAEVPVAGAQQEQQHVADMARAELAKDSTNVNARIALANILYDTGNWSEAIIHYRSALRTDPQRIETIVDLGVCYYNLSRSDEAYDLFQKALEIDPKHPIALFNLGIVSEARNRPEDALRFYQRAKDSNPPQGMGPQLDQAIQRVQARMGGASGAGGSGGTR